jgi:hypothetical protein
LVVRVVAPRMAPARPSTRIRRPPCTGRPGCPHGAAIFTPCEPHRRRSSRHGLGGFRPPVPRRGPPEHSSSSFGVSHLSQDRC